MQKLIGNTRNNLLYILGMFLKSYYLLLCTAQEDVPKEHYELPPVNCPVFLQLDLA